ncbi:ABC transporter substrate-binding protein [Cryptosporangium aurantiacum]|uniref:Amino acid/amide ABC transporter substrate-binding protein, HAAT family n=1 Tax=Cryptosporangium aurantiacum TaxID=134849 RepID=A0A1M7Q1R5_9ACTN|nr:ABC transporter substrate-binding protein [Cryptosporangium aurantiacum]SHN24020.1 amino acid/amide ABC transporter substrate-binding protein, HAAT family [Cryptosporangium aurantiacum]
MFRSRAARRALIGALVLALASTTAACSRPSKEPIRIALADAQSGRLSALGAWELKGAKLAIDEWNENGGINGRKIQLDVFDEQGDPAVATKVARTIVSEKYIAMLGTAESAVTIAMAPILRQAKIPNITSGQSPGLVAVASPFLFLNGPTSTAYDETLAQFVLERKRITRIALITNDGSYGKGEKDAFTEAVVGHNVMPLASQVVTADQKDFSAALTSIRQTNPDALFIGAEEIQSGLIAKQARELGIHATFIGGAALVTPVFLATAGAKNAENSIVSSAYLSNDLNDATRKFADAYRAAYKEEPELHGAKAYDGAQILLTALKNSDVATGAELAEAIRDTTYNGLLGSFAFDETGVGMFTTSIGVITQGKVTPVAA